MMGGDSDQRRSIFSTPKPTDEAGVLVFERPSDIREASELSTAEVALKNYQRSLGGCCSLIETSYP